MKAGVVFLLLLLMGLSAPAQPTRISDLESQILRAKERLADLDYQAIEGLLDRVRSHADEENLRTLEGLLVESLGVETRAIWLDSVSMDQLVTRAQVAELMETLASININLILADIYGNGHSVWPSQVAAQRNAFQFMAREDMVQVLIEEAHKRGMEIHGLVSLFGFDAYGILPFMERMEWLDQTATGGFLTGVTSFEAFLSPAVPEVREYLLAVIREMAQYDLDGIHLDYIRHGRNLGYHPQALELFRQEGGDPENLTDPPQWAHFLRFKSSLITSFVAEASREIQAINPHLLVSAAVASPLAHAQAEVGQDWAGWAQQRLVHFLCHMGYVYTASEYSLVIEQDTWPIRDLATSFPGIGLYNLDAPETIRQIQVGQNRSVSGQALFSTIHLTSEMVESLRHGVYRKPAMPTYRDPQSAAARILEDLARRLTLLGADIGLDPDLVDELSQALLGLQGQVLQAPIRPWDARNLGEGSPEEVRVLSDILEHMATLNQRMRALPRASGQRARVELERAARLIRMLSHYATDQVVLRLPDGKERVLPQVPAASGVRYSDGEVTLWTKGDQFLVEVGQDSYQGSFVFPEVPVYRFALAPRDTVLWPGWVHLPMDFLPTH